MLRQLMVPAAFVLCLGIFSQTSLAQTGLAYSFNSQNDDQIRAVGFDGTDLGAFVSKTPSDSPFGVGYSSTTGRIFWTDINSDRIYSANQDGSNVTSFSAVFAGDSRNAPYTLAIDSANDRIFWGDLSTQSIRTSATDGSGATTVATGAGFVQGMKYDASGNRILWTDFVGDKILSHDLSSGITSTLIDLRADLGGSSYNPASIALSSTKLYFNDATTDKIYEANLDGSSITELLDLETMFTANGNFGDGDTASRANDLLFIDNKLYWTEGDSGKRGIFGYDLTTSNGFRLLDTESIDSRGAPLRISTFTAAVPEPSSAGILLAGLAGLGILRRKKKS